jgi:hypothetical protein
MFVEENLEKNRMAQIFFLNQKTREPYVNIYVMVLSVSLAASVMVIFFHSCHQHDNYVIFLVSWHSYHYSLKTIFENMPW